MRFVVLATDYDETLALEGRVAPPTLDALRRLRASGRAALLVTGRELDDVRRVFPEADQVFDAIVAENGGVLWVQKEERLLGEPPPPQLVARLRRRLVDPLSVGRVILATREPHQTAVLEEIRALGLEHQVIFNRGAVMILPPGVNKGTGLAAALSALKLSPRNAVAIGDGENDHALLALCECGVAVAGALQHLGERADVRTAGGPGAGVVEIVDALLADDLASRAPAREVPLGQDEAGAPVGLPVHGACVLFAGPPGSGKSTAAKGFVERLIDAGRQVCIVDPEGDYETFDRTVCLGDANRGPTAHEVLRALAEPDQQVVASLVGVPLDDRPDFVAGLLPRLQELRAQTGRPHWIVLDETHHLLPASWQPAQLALPQSLESVVLITVAPHDISPALLAHVDLAVAVGDDPETTLGDLCSALGEPPPATTGAPLARGEVLLWDRRRGGETRRVQSMPTRGDHHRHRRKYAEGELAPERSFYFRGPAGKLNLRAQNLSLFTQLASGVDDETWEFHLGRGDYSQWFREKIKDPELADEAARVEAAGLPADESRARLRDAIQQRYTLPAGPAAK